MLNYLSKRLSLNSFSINFLQMKFFTNKAKKALRDHRKQAKVLKKDKQEAAVKYDFALKDDLENFEYDKRLYYDKSYLKIMNDWKDNMAAKQKAKALIKERFEHFVLIKFLILQPKEAPTDEKFVIHDVNKEISLPANQDQIFAVVQFKGFQHKITKDDSIILDKLDVDIGKIIVFDKVLLIGTPEYTSIGRPYIPSAKVS